MCYVQYNVVYRVVCLSLCYFCVSIMFVFICMFSLFFVYFVSFCVDFNQVPITRPILRPFLFFCVASHAIFYYDFSLLSVSSCKFPLDPAAL